MLKMSFPAALAISLLLHGAILWPGGWQRVRQAKPLPLRVLLPPTEFAQALATEVEPPAPRAQAAVPATTPVAAEKPRALAGRALGKALAALAGEEFYPREAIRQGIEGRVVLLLTLDEAGHLARIEVASSSGHALLDEAARQAAGRIERLPAGRRQVLLPVEFRLE